MASTVPPATATAAPVPVKQPTPQTLQIREKAANFIRGSYRIWKAIPESQRGLLATEVVCEEVIHTATAFHANEQGKVNIVFVKKDMPREALKLVEVGYWLRAAGPAPQHEQWELQTFRNIPSQVVDEIRRNNNHDLIAHYYYAFVDFWILVLLHLLIWLAALFFYGYLMIVNPTIIVGESSKLYRLLTDLSPDRLFKPNLSTSTLEAFLSGTMSLAQLKALCITLVAFEWEDLQMPGPDYLHIIGIPVILHYGPLPHQIAIYIPKHDPYAMYHIPSLRSEFIAVDRCARLVIELSLKAVEAAGDIPDNRRKEKLQEIRVKILKGMAETGVLFKLRESKAALKQAYTGFGGAKSQVAYANRSDETKAKNVEVGKSAMIS